MHVLPLTMQRAQNLARALAGQLEPGFVLTHAILLVRDSPALPFGRGETKCFLNDFLVSI
jgi:hypothetical protein